MNPSFLLAGTLAYALPTFLIAAPWHLKIFKAHYDRLAIYRADLIMPFGIMAMLIQGVAFSIIYAGVIGDAPLLPSILKFGLLTGAISYSFHVLPVAAKHHMNSVSAFMKIESVFVLVQFAVTAPLTALAWQWTSTA